MPNITGAMSFHLWKTILRSMVARDTPSDCELRKSHGEQDDMATNIQVGEGNTRACMASTMSSFAVMPQPVACTDRQGFFIRLQYQRGIASAKRSNSVTVHMIFNMPSIPMAIWKAAGACAWPSGELYLPDNTRQCATITTNILEDALPVLGRSDAANSRRGP